jgi:hypothetical protein
VWNNLRALIVKCSASKSAGVGYPILTERLPNWPQYSTVDEMKSELTKLRMALKKALTSDNPAKKVSQVVEKHCVSQTIDIDYWRTFNLVDWVLGWNNRSRQKNIKTISAAVGWGYLIDTFCNPHGLPHLLKKHPTAARPILQAAEQLHHVTGKDPWWREMIRLEELSGDAEHDTDEEEHGDLLDTGASASQSARHSDLMDLSRTDTEPRRVQQRTRKGPEATSVKEASQPRKRAVMNMVVELPLSKKKGVRSEVSRELSEALSGSSPSSTLHSEPNIDIQPELVSQGEEILFKVCTDV